MAKTRVAAVETREPALRRCTGGARFGIEAHEAAVDEFPSQPSQKDGLGRMCRRDWNIYTAGLARDAKAGRAAESGAIAEPSVPVAAAALPARAKGRRIASTPQGNRYESTAPAVETVGSQ